MIDILSLKKPFGVKGDRMGAVGRLGLVDADETIRKLKHLAAETDY